MAKVLLAVPQPPRQTMREWAYGRLKEGILSGVLAPGTRLVEAKLAEEIQVSRTPIREALHKLELEGLVRPRARRGFVVDQLTREDAEEIMDLRELLECHATRRAARRVDGGTLRRLQDLVRRAEGYLARGDLDSVFRLNTTFHDLINQAAGSRRLSAMIDDLRKHVLRLRTETLRVRGEGRKSIAGHQRVLDALARRDAEVAARVMAEHVDEARQAILKLMGRGGSPPAPALVRAVRRPRRTRGGIDADQPV